MADGEVKNMKQKNGLKRLLQICIAEKGLVTVALLFLIISAVAGLAPYLAMYGIVSEILTPMIDTAAVMNTSLVFRYIGYMLIGIFLNIAGYFTASCLLHKAAFKTIYSVKSKVLRHFTTLPISFSIRMGSGSIRKILDEDIGNTEEFLAHQFPDCIYTIVSCVAILSVLLWVDWHYGVICLLIMTAALAILSSTFQMDKKSSRVSEYFKASADMNNLAVEYVRGISVMKIFHSTLVTFEKFYNAIKRYTKAATDYTLQLEKTLSAYTVLIHNIYLFLIPVIICLGQHCGAYIPFVSKIIFCVLLIPVITAAMLRIVQLVSQTTLFNYGMKNVDAILMEPSVSSPTQEYPPPNHYDVVFENVSFSYTGEESKQALQNVSFKVREKQVTAIVGPSGSGKSTIAQLLPRFYDIRHGRILIGGQDIRDIDMNRLMGIVSFVFQDAFLFKRSIRENIAMGRENATKEEIILAAKSAQCHDFICQLPQGYDTVVGSDSVHLSGGERQRVAIARAILQNTPVLVLDEATAFNDSENEYLIQKAFEKLLTDKTVLMIAHRLNTIRDASQILVMEEGRIAESGTHEELLQRNGKYHAMWDVYTQTRAWHMGGDVL